ncbi:hypothetical protein [Olleya marilimosa]|uniref:Lipoprotein n=1 Tax=Olleya marilimosa TaxID=272164 RepID=A0ABR8LWN6_9FLAO|nr:hypothetical protein [Olleya marilimosa]MBD3864583.1 hypothetical protein [Olleya marilimosa]
MKKSKNQLSILLFLSLFCVFTNCEKEDVFLSKELNELKNSNKKLNAELDSLKKLYINPFKQYENIVLDESKNNPDSIINEYEKLIKNHPNSFWKHESERRIKNIEKRKKYWTKKNGWKLNDIPKKPLNDEQSISCPGC